MHLAVTPISRDHLSGVVFDHAGIGLKKPNELIKSEEEEYPYKEVELQRRDLDMFQVHQKEKEVAEAEMRASQEE